MIKDALILTSALNFKVYHWHYHHCELEILYHLQQFDAYEKFLKKKKRFFRLNFPLKIQYDVT